MKNPFEKKDNSAVIFTVAISAVALGALAYLFLTDQGQETQESVKHQFKDKAKELSSNYLSNKTGVSKSFFKNLADKIVK
ncbi:hypothetical protein [Mucilaginibacter sp. CSA2-8R]|jgi:hypothetical protein|uniref:hypothetical protein n=1 Tax=Mucilaginibacter sp. CSA2-8R TaxID=3141542 RepID=UPI00315D4FE5